MRCWGCGMLGIVGCSGCGMLGMWDVGDVRCWEYGMIEMDVGNVGRLPECGMLIYKMPRMFYKV